MKSTTVKVSFSLWSAKLDYKLFNEMNQFFAKENVILRTGDNSFKSVPVPEGMSEEKAVILRSGLHEKTKEFFWEISTLQIESLDFEVALELIIPLLKPVIPYILKYRIMDGNLEVMLQLYTYIYREEQPITELDKRTIAFLYEVDGKVSFEVYAHTDAS